LKGIVVIEKVALILFFPRSKSMLYNKGEAVEELVYSLWKGNYVLVKSSHFIVCFCLIFLHLQHLCSIKWNHSLSIIPPFCRQSCLQKRLLKN